MGQRPPPTALPSTGRESSGAAVAWESREPRARPLPGQRRSPGPSARRSRTPVPPRTALHQPPLGFLTHFLSSWAPVERREPAPGGGQSQPRR